MVRYQLKTVDTMLKEMGKVERAYFAQCVTLAKLCRLLQEDVGDKELNKDQIDYLEDAFRAAKAAVSYVNNSKFDSKIARENFINAEGKLANLDFGRISDWGYDVKDQMMEAQQRDSVGVQRLAQLSEQAPREQVEVSVKICDRAMEQASETKRLTISTSGCVGDLLFLLAPPGQTRNTPTRLTFHPHFYVRSSQSPPTYRLLQPWETLKSLPDMSTLYLAHNKVGSPFILLEQETIDRDGTKNTNIVVTALNSELPPGPPLCHLEDRKTGEHLSTLERRWDELSTEKVKEFHELEWKLVIDKRKVEVLESPVVQPEQEQIPEPDMPSIDSACRSSRPPSPTTAINSLFGVDHGEEEQLPDLQVENRVGWHVYLYALLDSIFFTLKAVFVASSPTENDGPDVSLAKPTHLNEVPSTVSNQSQSRFQQGSPQPVTERIQDPEGEFTFPVHFSHLVDIPDVIHDQSQPWSQQEPPPQNITEKIHRKKLIAVGGNSDVWLGTLQTATGEVQVAIKELRVRHYRSNRPHDERIQKRFDREMLLWNKLRHRNIVPLLGFALVPDGLPQLVSPWYSNGTVIEYIELKPDVNRLQMLHDVAEGLNYLHSLPLVHGDIKGENVLVDEKGVASLCDFGLAKVTDEALHTAGLTTTNQGNGGTACFMCPELLDDGPKSAETDIWAFGCLIIQVMTGQRPYPNLSSVAAIQKAIWLGQSPLLADFDKTKVAGASFWDVAAKCWEVEPRHRPSIAELLNVTQQVQTVC